MFDKYREPTQEITFKKSLIRWLALFQTERPASCHFSVEFSLIFSRSQYIWQPACNWKRNIKKKQIHIEILFHQLQLRQKTGEICFPFFIFRAENTFHIYINHKLRGEKNRRLSVSTHLSNIHVCKQYNN